MKSNWRIRRSPQFHLGKLEHQLREKQQRKFSQQTTIGKVINLVKNNKRVNVVAEGKEVGRNTTHQFSVEPMGDHGCVPEGGKKKEETKTISLKLLPPLGRTYIKYHHK